MDGSISLKLTIFLVKFMSNCLEGSKSKPAMYSSPVADPLVVPALYRLALSSLLYAVPRFCVQLEFFLK